MGKSQRDKGARGEREAVHLLRRYGLKAKRRGGLQAGKGRAEESDLPDVTVDGSPFWIEVKRCKLVPIRAAFRQAVEDAPGHLIPVVLWKDDRGEWMFTANAVDILDTVLEVLERTEVIEPRRREDLTLANGGE